ncbi:MAG: hypothetical protein PHI68_07230 [Candidatus Cloacimonetes bacterium]|nr:hypothetical protein [Candidatus Cloacimonadota bacterium]
MKTQATPKEVSHKEVSKKKLPTGIYFLTNNIVQESMNFVFPLPFSGKEPL